jgi:hypothetical protein
MTVPSGRRPWSAEILTPAEVAALLAAKFVAIDWPELEV